MSEADAKQVVSARSRLIQNKESESASVQMMNQAREMLAGIARPGMSSDMASNSEPTNVLIPHRKVNKLPVILKADSMSTLEAISNAVKELSVSDDDECSQFNVVISSLGDITTSDVDIASHSKARIFGFNVNAANNDVTMIAKGKDVHIKSSHVIYDLMNELNDMLKLSLHPALPGRLLGRATVLKVFNLGGKKGRVAGCVVKEGTIIHIPSLSLIPNDSATLHRPTTLSNDVDLDVTAGRVRLRVVRNKRIVVGIGDVRSLRIEKTIVSEVAEGKECGIVMTGFNEFVEGDVIECFQDDSSSTITTGEI